MSYPSKEGEVLGSIIWKHMLDNFDTGKSNYLFDDDFIKCFLSSHDKNIKQRVENLKSYIAIRNGIVEYINGYSICQKIVNISKDDKVELSGSLDIYNRIGISDENIINDIYNIYSFPNIFAMNGHVDYVKNAEELFDIITSWLLFPFIEVKVYGAGKGINIAGIGYIKFGSNEEHPDSKQNKTNILNKLSTELNIVNKELINSIDTETGLVDSKIYQKYWMVIASAVVEFLNINTVSTVDGGSNNVNCLIGSATTPDVGVYIGVSEGSCVFGSTIVSGMNITVLGITFDIPFDLKIPPICFDFDVEDKDTGITKTTRVCLSIDKIITDITNLAEKIITVITDAIEKALEFITKILNGVMTEVEKIEKVLEDAFNKFMEGCEKFITAVTKKLEEFLNSIIDIFVIPAVETARAAIWSVITSTPAGLLVYNFLKLKQYIKQVIDSIEIIDDINTVIININETISVVYDAIIKRIVDIETYISEHLKYAFNSDECNIIETIIKLLSSIPIPDEIPVFEIPTIPSLPDDGAQCPTGETDPDTGEMICEPCNEDNQDNIDKYGNCPIYDDDGNLIEIPIVPPPFMPVNPGDDDYELVKETVKNTLPSIPSVELKIPMPKINIYKKVLLDNGHGGIINGVYQTKGKRSPVWSDGLQVYEGVFNRQVVKAVSEKLNKMGIPNVILVDTNKDVPLKVRTDTANSIDPSGKTSIYVSIHSNAASSVEAKGFEAYSYNYNFDSASPYNVDVFYHQFAKILPNETLRYGYNKDFLGKIANFYVLKHTKMPAVLTENFFMTNERECRTYLVPGDGMDKVVSYTVNAIDIIARIR